MKVISVWNLEIRNYHYYPVCSRFGILLGDNDLVKNNLKCIWFPSDQLVGLFNGISTLVGFFYAYVDWTIMAPNYIRYKKLSSQSF